MAGRRILPILAAAVLAPAAFFAGEIRQVTRADCTFVVAPEEQLSRQGRIRELAAEHAEALAKATARRADGPPVVEIRNFIDVEIFGALARAGVAPARQATDEEFLRRVYLDLTGQIPPADTVRRFLADDSPEKRRRMVRELLNSSGFVDRWTMWLGDLLQNNAVASNVSRQISGRNAFHAWIREAVATNKSLHDVAWEAITATGNTFDPATGAANYPAGAVTPMGPIQDTFDAMLVRSASAFLGMGHYDCLLCHDGRGHLDAVSLWGSRATRLEAQRMAAFFSRMRITASRAPQDDFYYRSYEVSDAASGQYALNTNYGNRTARTPVGGLSSLTPQYRDGWTPSQGDWRAAFADRMTADPMFARNLANRIWKHFFGMGLVEPVDALDPARLDPGQPPPAPWSWQATHPVLLERLAEELRRSWYDLRHFIGILVDSSAYQLSTRYSGVWRFEYVPLFARHYPRRLEGEEIHDAIARATGIPGRYSVQGWAEPVEWALQLPEPAEPRSNGAVAAFLNVFLRGNRDTQPRSQSLSSLQRLALMNDNFVLSRLRVSASPTLQAIAREPRNEAVVEELFLTFLGRRPAPWENEIALARLGRAAGATARNQAVEDLAWALVNKIEFLFSY